MYATTIIETSAMKAWERAMRFVAKSPDRLKFGGGLEVKHALDSQVSIILDNNAIGELLNEQWHPSDPFCAPERIKAYKAEYKKGFDASVFDYTYSNILKQGFSFVDDNCVYHIINQIDICWSNVIIIWHCFETNGQVLENKVAKLIINNGIDFEHTR